MGNQVKIEYEERLNENDYESTDFDRKMSIGFIVFNVIFFSCLFLWAFKHCYLQLKARRHEARPLDIIEPRQNAYCRDLIQARQEANRRDIIESRRQAARRRDIIETLITNRNESHPNSVMPSAPTIDSINETTQLDTIDQKRHSVPDYDNPPSYQEALTTSKVDLRTLK